MPAKKQNKQRPRRKRGPTNVPTQSGSSFANPSMDQHTELVQDVLLVSTGGTPGVHNYAIQAGVNELILSDPLSGTTSYQYGSVGGAFQNLANWWVTYTILSVQVTVQLYNITSGVINSPFLAATEAAELDAQIPTTYQEFAQTGRMTVSNSLTGTISRSQNFQKFVRENLPRPYLNTMSANTTAREIYLTTFGATPVIQIAWQSQISSFSTDFEIPKFIAIISTNTRYHFRGRRTFYPGLNLNRISCPSTNEDPPLIEKEKDVKQITIVSGVLQAQHRVASLQRELYEAIAAFEPTPR